MIVESLQEDFAKHIQEHINDKALLAKVIDLFPYPIQVFSRDGTARLINKAALDIIGIECMKAHVGSYNVFNDPIVTRQGAADKIRQVLHGEVVYLLDFSSPYEDLRNFGNIVDRDVQSITSDITVFPLIDDDGSIDFFVAVFIGTKLFRGKQEIEKGKKYIETHWKEPFSAENIAQAACLSKSYFTKLFKKHTGFTPHEYYTNIKVNKLKLSLLDNNTTIAQAFTDCGMDYNSHFAKLFRRKVGVSPTEYRRMSQKN